MELLTNWDLTMRLGIGTLVVFCIVGGIVAQTSGGASGRGFMEGMWKGVEWWFIALVVFGLILGAFWVMGFTSNQLNSNW
jgi:hypothetical protein